MNKKIVWAPLAIALAVGIVACGKKEEKAADGSQIIKIGHVAPLTGGIAHLGKDNENGARLAVEEVNQAGLTINGKKVTLVWCLKMMLLILRQPLLWRKN